MNIALIRNISDVIRILINIGFILWIFVSSLFFMNVCVYEYLYWIYIMNISSITDIFTLHWKYLLITCHYYRYMEFILKIFSITCHYHRCIGFTLKLFALNYNCHRYAWFTLKIFCMKCYYYRYVCFTMKIFPWIATFTNILTSYRKYLQWNEYIAVTLASHCIFWQ